MAQAKGFITENEIKQLMGEVVDKYLIPKFKSYGMNATGEWLENVRGTARGTTGVIRGRDYTRYLANGRKPGSYAPIQPLKRWAKVKFGVGDRRATSIAFAVSTKLKQRGSKWYEQGGTDLINILNSDEVLSFLRERLRKILNRSVERKLKFDINQIFK